MVKGPSNPVTGGVFLKKKYLISFLLIAVMIASFVFYRPLTGTKPFQDLSVSDISGISIRLSPPDKTFELTEGEIAEVVEILHSVVLYNEDYSFKDYEGQGVTVTITKTDGTKVEATAYSPFFIIDTKGYKAKYGPCERLNSWANERRNETLYDRIPMVMVDGKLYYDTGRESTLDGRCGTMDGEIKTTVDASQVPTEDNQSNFGSGYGYQYMTESTIEVYLNDKWMVFEHRSDS